MSNIKKNNLNIFQSNPSDQPNNYLKTYFIKNTGCCGAASDAWVPSYPSYSYESISDKSDKSDKSLSDENKSFK